MKLFLSGKKFETKREPPPSIVRVRQFLDRAKDGELFTILQVANAIDLNIQYLRDSRLHWFLDYSELHNKTGYWGSRVTIKQLKKELSKHAKHQRSS